MRNHTWKFVLAALTSLALAQVALAFSNITTSGGQPIAWPAGTVSLQLQLDNATVLSDRTTRATSVQAAAQAWNAQIANLQFAPTITAPGSGGHIDSVNQVFFAGDMYGQAFGGGTLAITLTRYNDNTGQILEADVIFNQAYTWDSYRGNLQAPDEIRRVALHELGHVLGLDHPDDHGQSVVAVMNSMESDIDSLQADDIAGAQSLYGASNSLPSIFVNPVNTTVTESQLALFICVATGNPTPSYHWQRQPAGGGGWADLSDGGSYSGTLTTALSVTGTTLAMNGDQFRCVAYNINGAATSIMATLTVQAGTAPTISNPSNVTKEAGLSALFSVSVVTGNPTPTLKWQRQPAGGGGFSDLVASGTYVGVTSSTLTVNNTMVGMSGDQFRCVATNGVGSATSTGATLTVTPSVPPVITQQPSNQSILEHANASFSMAATSVSTIAYGWQVSTDGGSTWNNLSDTGPYGGSATATLSLTFTGAQLNGYRYRCGATNVAGTTFTNSALLTVTSPPAVIALTAGRYHSFRVDVAGNSWASGGNTYGQLSDGTTNFRSTPEQVSVNGAIPYAIAAGVQHTVFLQNGQVWAAGLNDHGQLGDGTVVSRSYAVETLPLVGVGIAAGLMHTAVLENDGTLWTVGGNDAGQLGNGTTTDSHALVQIATGVIDLAAGYHQTLFIRSDGTLWGTGDLYGNGTLALSPIQIATGVRSVAAGGFHSIFVKTDGTAWTLGAGAQGQLGDGTSTTRTTPLQIASNVRSVAAGYRHTLYVKTDNTLWAFGENGAGQLGDGTYGTRSSPVQVASNVATVAAGEAHTLFTKTDGSLWGTGLNTSGQFGDSTTTSTTSPVYIIGGTVASPALTNGPFLGESTAQDRVVVTWGLVQSAATYDLWRSTTSDLATATRIASNLRWGYFEDLNVTDGTQYYYWVSTVNATGAATRATSQSITYHSLAAPVFTTQPVDLTVNAGNFAVFTLGVTGWPKPTLQWQRLPAGMGNWVNQGGTNIAFNVTNTLTLAAVTPAMDGDQYRCVATNTGGTVTSNAVTLHVEAGTGPPQITLQPIMARIKLGDPTSFTIAATGAPTLNFQWQILGTDGSWYNVENIDIFTPVYPRPPPVFGGITTPTLTINTTGQVGMNGRQFRCLVTNGLGSATSNSAPVSFWSIPNDFNFDGYSDILWENSVTGDRAIWLMNGSTFLSGGVLGTIPVEWKIVAVADFNGDGKADILWENINTGEHAMWMMNGTNFYYGGYLGIIPTDWHIACTGDLDGDGHADLIWENTVTGERAVWLMWGANFLSGGSLGNLPVDWKITRAADFNGDGKDDLVLENTTTGDRVIWLMNGASFVSGGLVATLPSQWRIAGTADFNSDGKADILWENTATGDHSIWLMNGTSFVSGASLGTIPTDWTVVGTGDYNGDGMTDIIWSNTVTGDRSIWLMNGTGFLAGGYLGVVPTDWKIGK